EVGGVPDGDPRRGAECVGVAVGRRGVVPAGPVAVEAAVRRRLPDEPDAEALGQQLVALGGGQAPAVVAEVPLGADVARTGDGRRPDIGPRVVDGLGHVVALGAARNSATSARSSWISTALSCG